MVTHFVMCVCDREKEWNQLFLLITLECDFFFYLPLCSFEAQLYCKFEIRKILPQICRFEHYRTKSDQH